MKRIILILLCISGLLFAIHEICANKQPDYTNNVDYVVEKAIQQHEECSHFLNTKTFIDYDVLRVGINDNGNLEYNILASGRGYHIDERGNLGSDCSFSAMPILMEISEDEKGYTVNIYRSENDKSNYQKFVKENFSGDGYSAWQTRERNNYKKKIDTLSMAEKYFGIDLYKHHNFECRFCGINRYFYDIIKNKTGENRDLYGIEPLTNRYFIFNSDGTAERFGATDAGEFTRHFGDNDSTLILKDEKNDEVIKRMIIDDLKSREMTLFTETIQVYQ